MLSIAVRTEPSSAETAVAVEHAGDASARAGSAGTPVPARPDVQSAQTTTPTTTSAAHACDASARDVGARSPMP